MPAKPSPSPYTFAALPATQAAALAALRQLQADGNAWHLDDDPADIRRVLPTSREPGAVPMLGECPFTVEQCAHLRALVETLNTLWPDAGNVANAGAWQASELAGWVPAPYTVEFPDFGSMPAEVAAAVASGILLDVSWGQDACPSFVRTCDRATQADDCPRLWVGHEESAQREEPGARRAVALPVARVEDATAHLATLPKPHAFATPPTVRDGRRIVALYPLRAPAPTSAPVKQAPPNPLP